MKKLIALLLCAAMVLSVLPLASAEGGEIGKITINGVPTPTDGAAIPYDSSTLTAADPQLYKAYYWSMSWRVSDGIVNADLSPTFDAGELYTLTLLIVPQNGATGLDETTAATLPVFIGGQKAKYDPDCKPSLDAEPGKKVFAYDVELRCAWTNEIRMIDVYGMILPATGAEPDVSTLFVPEDAPYTIADAAWWRYTTMPDAPGDEIRMEPGEKFVEGTWYYLDIDLVPKEGYFFAASEECYWRIDGTASLTDEEWSRSSGTRFDLFSADFQATSRHIDFIELNGMTETLYVGDPAKTAFENVTIPAGAGYTLVTDRKDVNVSKKSNGTYIKDDALFEAGESYMITLRVAPKEGWTIDADTVWRINGRMDLVLGAAESTSGYWYCRSFAIPATERTHIDRVQIFGVTDPVAGWMAIDCTTTYVANGPYELVERYWFNDDDDLMLIGDDPFELGKHYMMCNVVKPYEGYVIDDSTVFELNGGDYAVELSGGKPDGSYYVWTEPMEPLETCTVCWYLDVNDEYPVVGVEVIKGDVYGAPADPAKEGYIFGGWYTDKELTKPYDPTAPITEDTNLYPLWIPAVSVTAVDAKIAAPAVGQKPSEAVTLTVTPSDANVMVSSVRWWRWNEEKEDWDSIDDPDYTFEAGERYGVDIDASTKENTVFDQAVVCTVNGLPCNTPVPAYQSQKVVWLTYNWDKLPSNEPVNPFVDVVKGEFYYDPVLWAYYHTPQITKGLDATHFGPDATCTRGQIVTFLWRALGEPAPTITKNPFADVKESDYYYKAVLWAYENGITTGTDAAHFAPDDFCKREHAVAFLYRAAGMPAYTNTTNPFVDVSSSAYYYDAVLWAAEKNITKGIDTTHFGPTDACQRCQIVTFLYRFMNP